MYLMRKVLCRGDVMLAEEVFTVPFLTFVRRDSSNLIKVITVALLAIMMIKLFSLFCLVIISISAMFFTAIASVICHRTHRDTSSLTPILLLLPAPWLPLLPKNP